MNICMYKGILTMKNYQTQGTQSMKINWLHFMYNKNSHTWGTSTYTLLECSSSESLKVKTSDKYFDFNVTRTLMGWIRYHFKGT